MSPARAKGCLVGLLGCAALCATGEIALRVAGFENPLEERPILVWNPEEDRLMATGEYLFETDPRTLWRLRPGAVIQFAERERIDGPPEHVNEDGFRGPRIPLARTPGILRIATLGDSSTFGVGVHADETWSACLAAELDRRGERAEVLNGGVDGFTVRQGLERWRTRVARWDPDVVVAAFGAVNEHWPADETDLEKIERLGERSQALDSLVRWLLTSSRIVQGLEHVRDPRGRERRELACERQQAMADYLGGHAGAADWPFPRRVGVDEFVGTLGELAHEVERAGARLVVLAMPRRPMAEEERPVLKSYTRAVYRAAEQFQLQMLSVHARFRNAEKDREPEPSWFLHDYWHPSATGHARIADWLAPMILDATVNRGRDQGIGGAR